MRFQLGSYALIFIGIGTSAIAADFPSTGPAPSVPPVFTWTGFYVGGQVGGVWVKHGLTESIAFEPPLTGHANIGSIGVVGGVHGGYAWQTGRLVIGAEGDIEGSTLRKTSACLIQDAGAGNPAPGACFPQSYSFGARLAWQSSLRARLGYAWGNLLFYATGGAAVGGLTTRYTTGAAIGDPGGGSQSFHHSVVGFTIGGGLEYAINANWRARAEYRFTDFGKITDQTTSAGDFWDGYSNHHSIRENSVRIGLSYVFGAPPPPLPVTARY